MSDETASVRGRPPHSVHPGCPECRGKRFRSPPLAELDGPVRHVEEVPPRRVDSARREEPERRGPGPGRGPAEGHAGLVGEAVPLPHVALQAGADDVLPRRDAAPGKRDDVIERERRRREALSAVLTARAVTRIDVVAGELHVVPGRAVTGEELDDAGDLEDRTGRPDDVEVLGLDRDIAPLLPPVRREVGQDGSHVPLVEKGEPASRVREGEGGKRPVQHENRRVEHHDEERIAKRDEDSPRAALFLRRRRLHPSAREGAARRGRPPRLGRGRTARRARRGSAVRGRGPRRDDARLEKAPLFGGNTGGAANLPPGAARLRARRRRRRAGAPEVRLDHARRARPEKGRLRFPDGDREGERPRHRREGRRPSGDARRRPGACPGGAPPRQGRVPEDSRRLAPRRAAVARSGRLVRRSSRPPFRDPPAFLLA